MKNILNRLLLLSFFIFTISIYAQDKVEFVDVEKISSLIIEYEKSGEFQKALDELEKVSKNDSVYLSFLTSKSYYNIKLNNYEEAIKITEEGLNSNPKDLYYYFIMNKASSYLNAEQYDKAIQQYDLGLEKYPKNYLFYYNKGVALENLKKFEEASKMYQISIGYNPFYANSHIKLADLCYKQHLIAQSMMCVNMYLLLNPDGANSFDVLSFANNMVAKKNENEKIPDIRISVDDESFEEIDLIINNYAALSKNYKTSNKIELAIVKQNHALFNQLKNYKGNGGFWDKYYVPFFLYINSNNLFDPFVYTTCYSVKNTKIKSIITKNEASIKPFIDKYQKKWVEIIGNREELIDGELKKVLYSYENSKIDGFGEYKNNLTVGKWTLFNSSGAISSIGYFNDKGEKTGDWTWFDNVGNVSEKATYKDGKLDGEYFLYFKNNKVNVHTFYKEDKLNGLYEKYNEHGALIEKYNNIDGNLEGDYLSFYPIGENYMEYKVPYKTGKINGVAYQYFPDGKIQAEIPFTDGNRNGIENIYFYNGQLEYKKEFKDNKLIGEYNEYHSNGKTYLTGNCVNGLFEGPFKQYYSDGTLEKELIYSKGSINGVMKKYDSDSMLFYEYIYKDGEIVAYKFYGKDNKIIKEAKKQKSEFFYEGYSSFGNKTSEGLYNITGGKKGAWKFYDDNQVLESEEFYIDNKLDGDLVYYYKNGKIKSVSPYKKDTLQGYFSSFYPNGQLMQQGWYKNGNSVGVWLNYHPDGKISSKNYYSNDKLNGIQENFNVDEKLSDKILYEKDAILTEYYFDEKGNITEEININVDSSAYTLISHYNNGKIHNFYNMLYRIKNGLYNSYYFDGSKRAEGNYLNGKQHGEWKWYYPNGKIETIGVFVYGKKEGIWKDYHSNGKLDSENPYYFGKLNGTENTYNDKGILTQTREFVYDVVHGERNFYSEEGKLQLTRHYTNGRLTGYSYFDKNSTKIPIIPIENETAKIVSYYDNGKIAREMEIQKGSFINNYNEYYYSGQLFEEQIYVDDERHGTFKQYYPDGKLKVEKDYFHGYLHGSVKEYYPNGKLKTNTPYLNNEINGTLMTYNETGKLITEETYFGGEVTALKIIN